MFPTSTEREISYALPRCSRATTAKKCTKKSDARAKLLFCYRFFAVLVAVAVVVA